MGEAKRRGSFEHRKQIAIIRNEEEKKRKDIENDKHYNSERPYRSTALLPYLSMYAFANSLIKK